MHESIRIVPRFFKAHGHGNDYLIFEQGDGPLVTPLLIRRICHPHRGPGADGVVVVESARPGSPAMLRMFNPDGREFERSGNGLRIAGVYLTRVGRRGAERFPVEVAGDEVWLEVSGPDGEGVWDVTADMGRVEFPDGPPFLAPGRLQGGGTVPLRLSAPAGGDAVVQVMPVSVGNPHAVAIREGWGRREVEHYGPLIAAHPAFPRGTNVQFAELPVGGRIAIRIWERGVGATSASGTSACAAVAAAVKSGLASAGRTTVLMEGGNMDVDLGADWSVRLRGPVEEVCTGELTRAFLRAHANQQNEPDGQKKDIGRPGRPERR
ncbi:MAG: diaminopimelate epimerase [Gemmatimonadetes bacterium]|nr:diaminopimelate epimerase [Gemmatimonadota bacterium]